MRMKIKSTLTATALLLAIALAAMAYAEPSLEWNDRHDGGAQAHDDGTVALTDPEGNLIIGGESTDTVGGSDMFIRKLSRDDGTQMWDYRWSSFDGNDMAVTDMCWDPFGDVLVGGYIRGCVG